MSLLPRSRSVTGRETIIPKKGIPTNQLAKERQCEFIDTLGKDEINANSNEFRIKCDPTAGHGGISCVACIRGEPNFTLLVHKGRNWIELDAKITIDGKIAVKKERRLPIRIPRMDLSRVRAGSARRCGTASQKRAEVYASSLLPTCYSLWYFVLSHYSLSNICIYGTKYQ